jgi:hypothetical protein
LSDNQTKLVIFSLETGFQYTICTLPFILQQHDRVYRSGDCQSHRNPTNQWHEAGTGIGQWQQTRHTDTFQIKSYRVRCTYISIVPIVYLKLIFIESSSLKCSIGSFETSVLGKWPCFLCLKVFFCLKGGGVAGSQPMSTAVHMEPK